MSEKIERIINGKRIVFEPGRHIYTVDGIKVPSVTGILNVLNKPALMPWAAKVCAEKAVELIPIGRPIDEVERQTIADAIKAAPRSTSKAAMQVGTIVHDWAEAFIKGEQPPDPVNEQAQMGVLAFLDWFKEHNVKPEWCERLLYSENGFAGKCDLIAQIDGVRCLVDFKTSTGIYPEMWLQVAAYAHADAEEMATPCELVIIARFDKDSGRFETASRGILRYQIDFRRFRAALDLYNGMKEEEERAKR